jgi:hypothetical protein
MLGTVISDARHVMRVLNDALIHGVLIVCRPELLDVSGDVNV